MTKINLTTLKCACLGWLDHWPVSESEYKCSDVRAEDYHDPVDNDQTREESQEKQPKPDEDVDFLVHWNMYNIILSRFIDQFVLTNIER